MKGELPPNAKRKMGPVGWEGRASSCGAEVSGCRGAGLDQGWGSTQSMEKGSRSAFMGCWEPQGGLEARTQLRAWSWGSVPGLGVVPWRQLPEGVPPSCHGACKVPPYPGDPQILEVNMSLRRGTVSLPGTMVKNSTNGTQV